MKSLTFLTLITCLIISCKSKTHSHNEVPAPPKQQDGVAHNQGESNDYAITVKLNNGQKWIANPETTEGIKKMKSILDPNEPITEGYQSIPAKLEKEFDTILQKCTMTGEAHNQLHNYLVPMKEMINTLNSGSTEVKKEALENLKRHLKQYDNYFQ